MNFFQLSLPLCSKILTWLKVGALRLERNKKDLCYLEVHFQVYGNNRGLISCRILN